MATWISGVVKGVTSGDAVIVVGTASAGGLPPEKQLFLSGISAPRLHEPFGISSRDFLRRRAVGRPCAFRLEGTENGREQASVVVDGTDNLALLSLANGCCRLKGDPPQESPPAKAQAQAQAARLGVWGEAPAATPPPTAADPASLSPNVTLKAVVESVLNGSMLRCTLGENRFVTASLAGVQCPSMNRRAAGVDTAGEQPQPEPFAREAKHHTEMRCLHRTVHLTPRGLDKFNNLLVTVRVEAGDGKPGMDVAEDIVAAGLARVAEWSVTAARLTDAARLRAAESQAVQARRGLWHNHVPAAPSNLGSFQARIVEVVSGDVVVVAHASTGAERRIGLASVRAPRMGNVKRGEPPTAAGLAAKEFLRASLIGRPVAVDLEYVRTTGGGDEGGAGDEPQRTMEMASLYEEKRDARGAVLARRSVAELLVAQGLATVTRHKAGDPRAARYDALLAAEEQARAAKRGLHSGQEEAALKPVQDLSRDAGRARAYHATLMRVGRLTAVVDFVISAGRLKLLVTKESVLILFSLAGVRSPRFATPGATEAVAFLRNQVLQREVIITIESVNMKTGVFMGSLTYPTAPGAAPSVNLATVLVQAGLASVHVTSDGRTDSRDLREAEAAAREKKLGLWAHEVEEASADDEADAGDGKDFPVVVSDVHSGQLFYIQQQAQVADIEARLAAASPAGGHSPAVSLLCLAQFSADERWYRARVLRSDSATVRQVRFIDYGNVEEVPTSRLAALDPSLAAVPAAAQPARLAFLAVPALDQDCGLAAAELLGSLTGGGRARFVARIEHRDRASGVVDVTLTPASDGQQSVNATMLGEGLARISKRAMTTVRGRAVAAELQVHQDRARKMHVGLFVYGDVDSDEDEL